VLNEPVYERLAYEAALRALDKFSRWSPSCLRLGPACTCSCRRPASLSLRWSAPDCTRVCTTSSDLGEVYRRLAYDLDRFWDDNDVELQKLFRAFRLATVGLSAEIVILIAMVSDTLF
jgi:hypothetical protein